MANLYFAHSYLVYLYLCQALFYFVLSTVARLQLLFFIELYCEFGAELSSECGLVLIIWPVNLSLSMQLPCGLRLPRTQD